MNRWKLNMDWVVSLEKRWLDSLGVSSVFMVGVNVLHQGIYANTKSGSGSCFVIYR